jgi:hypothetical protein
MKAITRVTPLSVVSLLTIAAGSAWAESISGTVSNQAGAPIGTTRVDALEVVPFGFELCRGRLRPRQRVALIT